MTDSCSETVTAFPKHSASSSDLPPRTFPFTSDHSLVNECAGRANCQTMKRVRGTVFTVPIVHGSVAQHLGDDATEARTHRWTAYVRPFQPAIISHFIRHVEFSLHESFNPSTRRATEMPYELHEFGWGEFDVLISIAFHDPAEKPVELIHPLHLFRSDGSTTDQPIVAEFYDEIVFQDPIEKMLNLLKTTPHGPQVILKPSIYDPYYKDFSNSESATLKSVEAGRKRLRDETVREQDRYEQLDQQRAGLLRQLNTYGVNNS